jgi:hypothetical protein
VRATWTLAFLPRPTACDGNTPSAIRFQIIRQYLRPSLFGKRKVTQCHSLPAPAQYFRPDTLDPRLCLPRSTGVSFMYRLPLFTYIDPRLGPQDKEIPAEPETYHVLASGEFYA